MQTYRKIFYVMIACLLAMVISAASAQRDYVGITDQAGDRLDVTASGTLPISSTISFSTGTIGVSANDLDIRALASGTDSVTATGTVTAQDGGGSLTVDATNLDIRDLSSVSDSIAVTGTVTATGSVTINTTGGAVETTLTDGTDTAVIDASGSLAVAFAWTGQWEAINYDVPPTSNSGSNLDPATGLPMGWFFANESTGYVRVCMNCTASAAVGLYVGPKGTLSGQFMPITTLSVYNPGAATASISIMYGRE